MTKKTKRPSRYSRPTPEELAEVRRNFALKTESKHAREDTLVFLSPNELEESPDNPRRTFDDAAVSELAASIQTAGILSPLLVRLRTQGAKPWPVYEVVCGARRLRAARLLELPQVPCIVRDLDDQAAAHIRLIENCQRQDVHPVEEAEALHKLAELGESAGDLAVAVGRTLQWVRRRLKLLTLPDVILERVRDGRVKIGAADAMASMSPVMLAGLVGNLDAYDVWHLVEVRRYARHHAKRLNSAGWDLDDAELVPTNAGACSVCPFNTAVQSDLFGHGDAHCTHAACFDERMAGYVAAMKADHEARGGKVVTERVERSERVWSVRVKRPAEDGEGTELTWVPIDEVLADLDLPDDAPPPYALEDTDRAWNPKPERVYLRDAVVETLRQAGEDELADQLQADAPAKKDGDLAKKDREKKKKKLERLHKAMSAVVDVAEKMAVHGTWYALAEALIDTLKDGLTQSALDMLLKRRGLKRPKESKGETGYTWRAALIDDELMKAMDRPDEGDIAGLLAELVLVAAADRGGSWKPLADLAGVEEASRW